jgi:hypothetical protein
MEEEANKVVYEIVSNVCFGPALSNDDNKSADLLSIRGLTLSFSKGKSFVGSALNVEMSCGIYEMFDFFSYY